MLKNDKAKAEKLYGKDFIEKQGLELRLRSHRLGELPGAERRRPGDGDQDGRDRPQARAGQRLFPRPGRRTLRQGGSAPEGAPALRAGVFPQEREGRLWRSTSTPASGPARRRTWTTPWLLPRRRSSSCPPTTSTTTLSQVLSEEKNMPEAINGRREGASISRLTRPDLLQAGPRQAEEPRSRSGQEVTHRPIFEGTRPRASPFLFAGSAAH